MSMLLLQIQALQMAFKRGRCITSWEKAFTNKHSPLVLGLVLTPASQQPDEPTKRKSSPATFCSTTVRRTAVITPREVRHENLNMGSYQHRQRRGKAVAAARGGAPVAAHGPNGGAVGSGGEEGEHHAQDVRMDAPTTRPPRAPCRILAYSGSSGGVPSDTSPANKKTPALLQTTTGDETPVGTL